MLDRLVWYRNSYILVPHIGQVYSIHRQMCTYKIEARDVEEKIHKLFILCSISHMVERFGEKIFTVQHTNDILTECH